MAKEKYLCAVLNNQRDSITFHILTPYIWKGDIDGKYEILYGWLSNDTSLDFDNYYKPMRNEGVRVICWKKLEN